MADSSFSAAAASMLHDDSDDGDVRARMKAARRARKKKSKEARRDRSADARGADAPKTPERRGRKKKGDKSPKSPKKVEDDAAADLIRFLHAPLLKALD